MTALLFAKVGTARACNCDVRHKSALFGNAGFPPSSRRCAHDSPLSCDYISTTLLTTYRAYARWIRSLAHRGPSPETILKAERGVASRGGGSEPLAGPPPSRHYDLRARSSLHGADGNRRPLED